MYSPPYRANLGHFRTLILVAEARKQEVPRSLDCASKMETTLHILFERYIEEWRLNQWYRAQDRRLLAILIEPSWNQDLYLVPECLHPDLFFTRVDVLSSKETGISSLTAVLQQLCAQMNYCTLR